mmetsp:Transcript_107386/g.231209  ORF Transcript_107386/g.231209 Transcript_107386/m.231209 type:complete len:203 (-) Transcript_107386:1615-2223(-)
MGLLLLAVRLRARLRRPPAADAVDLAAELLLGHAPLGLPADRVGAVEEGRKNAGAASILQRALRAHRALLQDFFARQGALVLNAVVLVPGLEDEAVAAGERLALEVALREAGGAADRLEHGAADVLLLAAPQRLVGVPLRGVVAALVQLTSGQLALLRRAALLLVLAAPRLLLLAPGLRGVDVAEVRRGLRVLQGLLLRSLL